MDHRATRLQETASFAAGILIGASIVTPVFAATSDLPAQWQPFLLIGSVVLLAIALMLKVLGARPSRRGDLEEKADMRDANRVEMIDVPLHQ
jgi:cytochrome c biogenesis protein CcdA